MHRIRVIDSHTGGEPTRLVLEGGPELGSGRLDRRVDRSRRHFDRYRTAVVGEPRGSEPMVGARLCEPHQPGCTAGMIFFNSAGMLGMCGHVTIGLVASLAHGGRIAPGNASHRDAGAVGWIAGLANALPDESMQLFEWARAGEDARAMSLSRWFLPPLRRDPQVKFVQLVKLVQQEVGCGSERVRPPRLTLSGQGQAEAPRVIRTSLRTRPVPRSMPQVLSVPSHHRWSGAEA